MKGFDEKALILFPYYENIAARSSEYKYELNLAVAKLCRYLESIGVEPHVFYSDDTARSVDDEHFRYISTLGRGDAFFTSKYCEGMSEALSKPDFMYEDIYNEVIAKDLGSSDMDVNERFEMVLRHSNKAASKIIPLYKIVIHFKFKNKTQYKVTSKVGDGKIRINVDANSFMPEAFMGGMSVNVGDLLNAPYANRTLDRWEC